MAKKNSRPNLAARKSASKKAEEQKLAARKAYWEAHKKQILTVAAIAVAAIVVVVLAFDYFYVPAHAVRSFMGNLIGMKDNTLVRELDGHYYELAEIETPAGYEPADYGMDMTNDPNENFFYYRTTEEGKAVESIYTIGVKNRTAAEMVEMASASFQYEVQSENKQTQIAGKDVHYFYSQGLEDTENNPGVFIATMTCYVDTIEGSCVLVSLGSKEGALDVLPSEEAMLAEAEAIFASIKLPQ